ncbi:hypothetical protein FB107DRAFT_293860 [Schizophyllum commune]
MGLAGRKQKQRIGHDPRNLSWADDASRFGQNYLAKFGWDASKGLGAQGEGRTSAIKVSQKLDMMGIGAAHTKDPNGIAWKQSKDYENLLARLNAAAAGEAYAPATGVVAEGGFVKPTEDGSGEGENTNIADTKENAGEAKEKAKEELEREKKEKKRKRKEQEGEGEDGEKKSKKRKKERSEESTPAPAAEESSDDEPLPAPAPRPVLRRAHRSRHIAFKSMATKDAAAVAEILGVAPTPSSLSSTASPMGALTPISDEPATMEKLMKSTKSVADYFKERLAAKAAKSGSSTPVPPSGTESVAEESTSREESEGPRGGLGSSRRRDEEEDAPRGGLGSSSGLGSCSGLEFSAPGLGARPRDEDESAPRGGLGSFARMFQMPSTAPTTETGKGMAMFAALSSSKVLSGEAAPVQEAPATETEKERRKREKKEKKRKEAEEQENEEKAAKKDKKGKKGKGKQGDAVEVTVEITTDIHKESKKRKRDKQTDDDSTPSAAPTPSNDSEATPVEDSKTKEERKAEKRRRKEEKKRKEA